MVFDGEQNSVEEATRAIRGERERPRLVLGRHLPQRERDLFTRLPAAARDIDEVAGHVIILVRRHGGERVALGRRLSLPAGNQRPTLFGKRRSGRADSRRRRGGGLEELTGPGAEQLRSGNCTIRRATHEQHVIVERQPQGLMIAARPAHRPNRNDAGGNVDNFCEREVVVAVIAARQQHAAVDQRRGAQPGSADGQRKRCDCDRTALRLHELDRSEDALAIETAGDQHAAVLQEGRGMPRPRRRQCARRRQRVVERIEDVEEPRHAIRVLAADDQHTAVGEIRSRSGPRTRPVR